MKKFVDFIPFFFLFLLIFCVIFSVVYFTGIIDFSEKKDYELIFNCSDFTMEVGDSVTLEAYIDSLNDSELEWESSDSLIVTVDDGVVTSKSEGSALITVKSESYNKSATCKVTVLNEMVEVSSIKFEKDEISLLVEENYKLNVEIYPSNAGNQNLVWESSDENIAVVKNGVVTAKKNGTAIITVKTVDKGITDSCKVIVLKKDNAVSVTKVTLNNEKVDLYIGDKFEIDVFIEPANATNKSVAWQSSNTSVATVNNGVVTAKGMGTATITVTTVDGNKTAKLIVTVQEKKEDYVAVSNISISPNSLVMKVGEQYSLNSVITPANATNKSVIWQSSNTNVATVNNGVVTAKGIGSAIITATVEGKSATVKVTVNSSKIPVTSITLNKNSDTIYLNSGVKNISLSATVLPSNATNKIITWSSSNLSVATVDNGIVTINGPGTSVITATSDGKSASYTVTVKQKIIMIIGASQVGIMNRYNKSYVSPNGYNYNSSDNTLKYIYKSGSGIPYQYVGGDGWNNALSFVNNYSTLKQYIEFHIFFPLSGNEIKKFTCDQISSSNTSIQNFAKNYNASIQNLKNQNYNVKGYVVSMHPVRVTETDSDNVVSNQNKNSCVAGYRSNIKYLTFNRAIKAVILNKYQNNLKFESLFVKIMNINEEGKNFSFKWEYYHTTDGIHWDEKTSQLYVKEMLDYYNEL